LEKGPDTFAAIYTPQSQKLNAYLRADWEEALNTGNP
jgi:hypothetical protein